MNFDALFSICFVISFNEIYFKTHKIACSGLHGAGTVSDDARKLSHCNGKVSQVSQDGVSWCREGVPWWQEGV